MLTDRPGSKTSLRQVGEQGASTACHCQIPQPGAEALGEAAWTDRFPNRNASRVTEIIFGNRDVFAGDVISGNLWMDGIHRHPKT